MNFMQEKIERLDVINADELKLILEQNNYVLIQQFLFYNSLSKKFKNEEDEEYKIYCGFYGKQKIDDHVINVDLKDYIAIVPIDEDFFFHFYYSRWLNQPWAVALWHKDSRLTRVHDLDFDCNVQCFINEALENLEDVQSFKDYFTNSKGFSDYFLNLLNVLNGYLILFRL